MNGGRHSKSLFLSISVIINSISRDRTLRRPVQVFLTGFLDTAGLLHQDSLSTEPSISLSQLQTFALVQAQQQR